MDRAAQFIYSHDRLSFPNPAIAALSNFLEGVFVSPGRYEMQDDEYATAWNCGFDRWPDDFNPYNPDTREARAFRDGFVTAEYQETFQKTYKIGKDGLGHCVCRHPTPVHRE